MAESFDCKTGHVTCTGRPTEDGAFEIRLYSKPDHGHRPGEDLAPGADPGELGVILRFHDVRACDSFSLAIRGARMALEGRKD